MRNDQSADKKNIHHGGAEKILLQIAQIEARSGKGSGVRENRNPHGVEQAFYACD
jgi:hypothetical protein